MFVWADWISIPMTNSPRIINSLDYVSYLN
ncbi:hypothetical protein LOK49_LG01G00917 [Camellia lanceoleosa]|uniref:Uncharacterized protein n=2 Tax=Camellia lanceoleosa TaxID=1840588 RepID=A0ACC0J2W9_9ERIC|nr:hypothetical protein LOK49_LG13G02565 [Camellia lanceoleosa]KAI8031617.1 hypothetical protein LOK49_LG01G00917 [Camellia lanceoleosa]